ncbi:multimeric flavodoxin WrbA [Pelomonas saccharophila]|uniref:Multimeric flavodoxin WrbA n=1 Tax=Roseateles saccharophilus TaxID=304 RepID=A0ABU1YLX0_ROSSA|nr:NAD(P)H-dependent oxidoreductase [Roseateles saccharophilus]MDR7269853.1 multimeric flavodoxin WrbA [Roseateles saccharophilus]
MIDPVNRRVLVLLASTRADGNAELMARAAVAALPADVEVRWLRLAELALPPFEDIRHEGSGQYPEPEGDLGRVLKDTLWATDLLVAAPLYWYSVPAPLKLYLDHWSGFMRVPGVDFKPRMAGKAMHVLCATSSGEEPHLAQPLLDCLRFSADYMKMHWGGAVLGDGSKPGDVLQDEAAMAAAARLLVNGAASAQRSGT